MLMRACGRRWAARACTLVRERLHRLPRLSLPTPWLQSLLSPPLLTRDAALLARLLYRNKAQHRGSAHYVRLVGLNRALKTLAALHGGEALSKALASGAPGPVVTALHRLLATAAAASAVVATAGGAASALSAPLARSYFPALATAGLALAARSAALGSAVALAAAAAFNAASPLAGLPPPPWATEGGGEGGEGSGVPSPPPLPAVVAVEWVRGRRSSSALPVPRVVGKGGRLEVRAGAAPRLPAAAKAPASSVGVPIDRDAFEGAGEVVVVVVGGGQAPPLPPPLAVFDDRGGGLPPMPPDPPVPPPALPQPLIGRSKSATKRAAAKERAGRAKAAAAAVGRVRGWEGWVGGGGGQQQAPPAKKAKEQR